MKIGNVSVHYLSSCLLFQRPRAFDGFTQIVANNRGHLLPGVKRSRESPWGNFVGTYDMPLKIPGTKWNPSYSCQSVFTGDDLCYVPVAIYVHVAVPFYWWGYTYIFFH